MRSRPLAVALSRSIARPATAAKAADPATAATDRCPRCDATFACGIDTGRCWCAAVMLSDADRAQLAGAGYEGCLCPGCLRELKREG